MASKQPSADSADTEAAGLTLLGAVVTLAVPGRMYGSVPKSQSLVQAWIASQGEIPEESLQDKLAAVGTRVPEAPEVVEGEEANGEQETEERVSCGFRLLPVGEVRAVCLRDFMVKAMIGQAASTIGWTKRERGVRGVLREGFQIRPQAIPFERDGRPLEKPDGIEDFVGHVMTPQGRRSILKRCDYVEGVTFSFKMIWVPTRLKTTVLVTIPKLEELLLFAGEFSGIGSQRHFEAGKFQLQSIEAFTPNLRNLG